MDKYYSKRAREYEGIYHRDNPVRQREQDKITEIIKETLCKRNVLDVACGTGYWATSLSEVAKSIAGIDNSDEVLGIARNKHYKCPTYFYKCDAYNLPFREYSFDGCLVNFWFSHIPREKIEFFLRNLHRVLSDRARVLMVDNVFIKGTGGKLVQGVENSNTYKIRTLESGEHYMVLKNYYSKEQIESIFHKEGEIIELSSGKCFWYILYKLNKRR